MTLLPVALMDRVEVPTAADVVVVYGLSGLHARTHRDLDPLFSPEAVRALVDAARPDGDSTSRAIWVAREVCYRADERPELLTTEVRVALYGPRGALTDPAWMARGLRYYHAVIRDRFELIDPASALLDAARAYGDYLVLYHPQGQADPGEPFALHDPYARLSRLNPLARGDEGQPGSIHTSTPDASHDPAALRALLLAEMEPTDAEQGRQTLRHALTRAVERAAATAKENPSVVAGGGVATLGIAGAVWLLLKGGLP